MLVSIVFAVPFTAGAANTSAVETKAFEDTNALYVFAAGNEDTNASNAAIKWYDKDGMRYFYLTSNIKNGVATIFNGFSENVRIADTTIGANAFQSFAFDANTEYTVFKGGEQYRLKFMVSSAESSIFINGTAPDGGDLHSYLAASKSNSVSASGAIVDEDGTANYTAIKKIKGRGNTTWEKDKKPFNITYSSAVSIGKMSKGKKYSLLANYQDSSLSRNRFLYDLSDAVGMPYASDSRYVDFYMNNVYIGSYQMCQKVEVGSKGLVNDIDDTAYLNADGTLASDFPFLLEVDASAGSDDYYTNSSSGNKLTVKAPELAGGAAYYNEVLSYVRTKFDEMYNAVKNGSDNLGDLVDLDSLAKIYLINELGKNWDSGISSLFFVYKQDSNGNYKFFASPVWDYDNSLGNANGISSDLDKMGVYDYTKYTGWWVKHKLDASSNRATSSQYYNILGRLAVNESFMKKVAQVWFVQFVPALNTFASSNVSEGELYSYDVYYNKVVGSANMNYSRGWQLYTGEWICDHSSLYKASYDYANKKYTVDAQRTSYNGSFEAEFMYTVDWMLSRSAWLSNEFSSLYTPIDPTRKLGDVNNDGLISIMDATLVQKHIAKVITLSDEALKYADIDKNGIVNINDASYIQKVVARIITLQ